MTSHPTVRHGNVLVVFEGQRRIAWRRSPLAHLSPRGLWPSPREAVEVTRHISQGLPLLVVLHNPEATVSLFADQFAEAPPVVAALAGAAEGDLVNIHVPALDWLPADLRRRGLDFLRASVDRAAQVPPALCPPLLLSEPDPDVSHIRFAHQVRSCPQLDSDLAAIVEHAFWERVAVAA